jgi:hypothetical protein
MSKEIVEPPVQELSLGENKRINSKAIEASETALLANEDELLRQAFQALRAIRYGSIVLVKHEGRLVEVSKTVRIRMGRTANQNERGKE